MLDTFSMVKEISVMEQRYQAVLAVIAGGRGVGEVAAQFGVSRQSVHSWLRLYEDHGLEGLANRSHKPKSIPHQMPASVEAAVLELRREHRSWGPTRLVYELLKRGVVPVPSETGVYRALKRAGLIEPGGRRRRKDTWKRWERGSAMELWQMDIVGGVALRDGTFAKCLTGVDDHSWLCVSAKLMRRELSRTVCDGLEQALARFGVPGQILTDNGKVFTGKPFRPPVEVLFEKICRENGIENILIAPYSPTTTGKIERFHRSLRAEFLTGRVFDSLHQAQSELDAWVVEYNQSRPHQALAMKTPLEAFTALQVALVPVKKGPELVFQDGGSDEWVTRKVSSAGVVTVAWQQISVGKHRGGRKVDIHVTGELLQIWDGSELLKTVLKADREKEVRVKKAFTMPARKS
jgi:transposase InsO family protein